ncbi:sequence-specific DNA binding transcription factor [Forsythia ovata]|uniref:Sequence-specific DNA binding transcription factor n=1 Tax=Forsythia ovata TaxID=205694 RepID=A0ABD1TM52_9LAMI
MVYVLCSSVRRAEITNSIYNAEVGEAANQTDEVSKLGDRDQQDSTRNGVFKAQEWVFALESKGKKWVTTPTEFSMHWLVLSFCFQGEFPRLEVAIVIKMESNLSLPGDMMRVDHQQAPYPWQVPDAFSFQVGSMQKFDQPMPLLDGNKDERLNNFSGNSQWMNILGALNEQNEVGAEKREPVWQRIKWTDEMVKLLITAVSYVEEDALSDANNRERRNLFLPLIKGKWRAISNTMVERGYIVSPQQCEDKFNDLNKKYRRLNDILGRRTSCEVVENPAVLESINISNETKEEAKKILICKQLFYREMCSYHNRNRIFLLHDEALQQSLRSALKVKNESKDVIQAVAAKRQKLRKDHGVVNLDCPKNYVECTRSDPQSPKELANANSVPPMGVEREQEQNQRIVSRSLQLKKHMLQLRREMLELEMKKFEWLKSSQEEDRELIKMKQENELMKLENERLAFELTCREMGSDSK